MNVGKMADGRWLRADVIPLRLASYIDVPRSLPILRSHYREKHVAYRSDTHYGLEGSNNIVLLTTERYREYPMLIQGYGAGAGVTAAGVFANIMSISQQVISFL